MSAPTALETLPPSVGDAPVAALLLRDLAAALVDADRSGSLDPAAVDVDDDGRFHLTDRAAARPGALTDLDHAALAAPELFRGDAPDARSDVYAAGCLALGRYLGGPAVVARPLGTRPTASTRLAALRQAQRTAPARLGALPDPFRTLFAQAVAKERHLRPSPARLVALLDAALAATGGEDAARARVRRLIVLARVFEPGAPLAAVPAQTAAGSPLHLPLRSLPTFSPSRGFARAALIAAVTVVATGGVAVAAVVGLSGTTPRPPTPQAIETIARPSGSATPTASPVATTSAPVAAPTSAAPVVVAPVAPVGGNGGNGGNGSNSGTGGGSNSGGSNSGGSNSGSSGRGGSSGGSGSGGGTTRPPAQPPATSPAYTPPPAPPSTPAPSTAPSTPRPVETGTPTVSVPPTTPPASTNASTPEPSSSPSS